METDHATDAVPAETPDTRRSPARWFQRFLLLAGMTVVVATALGGLASRWWFADLLTQFTVQYVLILAPVLLATLLTRRWRWSLLFTLVMIANLWPVAAYYRPVPRAGQTGDTWTLRVLTQNVLVSNDQYRKVIDLVLKQDPDVIALQEVTPQWIEALRELEPTWKYHVFHEHPREFGLAVYSKLPIDEHDVQLFGSAGIPSLYVRLRGPGDQQLELATTHPFIPAGAGASEFRNAQLLLTAEELDPARFRVLAGDFNLTPWSPWFGEILRRGNLADTAIGYGPSPTWHLFPTWLGGVKIDHVLASPDIMVNQYRTGTPVGSDHLGLIVDLQIPFPEDSGMAWQDAHPVSGLSSPSILTSLRSRTRAGDR